MGALQYRGRNPVADYSVIHKQWLDAAYAAVRVDSAFINQTVAQGAVGLISESYVTQQDAKLAQKTTVDVADNNYLRVTELGQVNGLAKLQPNGRVNPAALPALQTQRKVFFKNADTLALTGTQTRELTVPNNSRDADLGTLTIPDVGFPYIPLLFATVTGGSINGPSVTNAMGTTSFAQLSILRSDNIRYSFALTSSQKTYETFTVMPVADPANSAAPISGESTFKLWAGLDVTGSTYTISAVGLAFWAVAMPGL